jgi:multicomponent Na+:H+ antiporter subunit E
MTTSRPGRARPRMGSVRSLQLSALCWLTLIWVMLWGELSVLTVVGGFLVAVVVCLVFPLPPLRMDLRVRPLRLLWLVVRFLGDVVLASAQVAWTTVQLRRQPVNAVIEVDLRTTSDFVLTVVAEMVSLVPGSLVVEVRRSTHTLFLHVLDAKDLAGAEKMRRQVFDLERRVDHALGAHTEQLTPSPGDPASPPRKES